MEHENKVEMISANTIEAGRGVVFIANTPFKVDEKTAQAFEEQGVAVRHVSAVVREPVEKNDLDSDVVREPVEKNDLDSDVVREPVEKNDPDSDDV